MFDRVRAWRRRRARKALDLPEIATPSGPEAALRTGGLVAGAAMANDALSDRERGQQAVMFAEREYEEVCKERDELRELMKDCEGKLNVTAIDREKARRQLAELEPAVRTLVGHLSDAWWVEAAAALQTLAGSFGIEQAPQAVGWDEAWAELRPASRAHLKLEAAVLMCLEAEVYPDTIERFVREALQDARHEEATRG